MNIEESKRLSIVDYLSGEGIEPVKTSGNSCWYLSPIRNERNPSFRVNRKENYWYDYGIAEGGDLVELVQRMYNLPTVSDALKALSGKHIASISYATAIAKEVIANTTYSMRDIELLPLRHYALLSYLRSRYVDIDIGRMYCREIHYKVRQKEYFGIAFGNLSHGYEVRNPHFKGCIGRKDITVLAHSFGEWQNGCLVFEGFMDFLSFLTLVKKQDKYFAINEKCDYMVLNSVANLKRALQYLERYTHIHCFLDNDMAGRKAVETIIGLYEYRVIDNSFRYANHKDINDYLMNKKI